MYSRPSSSVTRGPRPSRRKTGTPPTAPNARTGEFTPPGISWRERSNSARLRSYIGMPLVRFEKPGNGMRRAAYVGRIVERGDHGDHVRARSHDAGGIRR